MEINKYKNKSDDELVFEAGRARLIDAAPVEMQRRLKTANEKLKNAVLKLDKSTSRYSKILIALTIILVILTVLFLLK